MAMRKAIRAFAALDITSLRGTTQRWPKCHPEGWILAAQLSNVSRLGNSPSCFSAEDEVRTVAVRYSAGWSGILGRGWGTVAERTPTADV